MSSAPVQQLASSAEQCGISSTASPAATVESCPFTSSEPPPAPAPPPPPSPPPPAKYEYCDLTKLQLDLACGDKQGQIVLTKPRRAEKPAASVDSDYVSALSRYDLVVEALGDAQDQTTANGKVSDSKDARPLNVTATAEGSPTHSHFGPAHPMTALRGGSISVTTHAAPASAKIFAPSPRGGRWTTWTGIWPFGDDRVVRHEVLAESCGKLRPPQVGVRDLRMQLVVIPYEEWKISFGVTSKRSRSGAIEGERDYMAATDGQNPSRRTATSLTFKSSKSVTGAGGKRLMAEDSDKYEFFGDGTEKHTSSQKLVRTNVLAGATLETKEESEKFSGPKTESKESGVQLNKITIEKKVAGRKVEADVQKTIDNLMKIKELVDGFKGLFESVKIGWSFSISYELFNGSMDFAFGNRWPAKYAEENRVYYVERFFGVGGSCTFFQGKVEGMFGLEIDPWLLPGSAMAKIYLALGIKVSATAMGSVYWTNEARANAADLKLDIDGAVTAELGGAFAGRIAGWSVEGRIAIEGEVTLKLAGALSTRDPPAMTYSVIVGKETAVEGQTTPRYDAMRLVGEVVVVGDTTDRYAFDPIKLIEGKMYYKDEKLW